jgi:hypothetical protein
MARKQKFFKEGPGEDVTMKLQIDLTDGTSFPCCVFHPPAVTASLYQDGLGTPEILRDYEL